MRGTIKKKENPMNSEIYQKVYNMMLEQEKTNTEKNPLKNESMVMTQNIFHTLTSNPNGKVKDFIKKDPNNLRGFQRKFVEGKSLKKYLQHGDFYLMSKFKKRGADNEEDSPEVNLRLKVEHELGHKNRS
jgi:hypothetical protein